MIYSTCIYLIRKDEWLFLNRNKKKNDVNHDKFIGVGGKLEIGETKDQCVIRETFEETGFILQSFQECGSILFQYPHREDETCYIYTSNQYTGKMHECNEGQLVFVNQSDIFSLNLWEGDRIFLKRMLKGIYPFHYIFHYNENDELIDYKEITK